MAGIEDFESFTVASNASDNPFRATVMGNEAWDLGIIRIEPPALVSQEFLDSSRLYGDAHRLTFMAMSDVEGARSTLIRFEGSNAEKDARDNKEMIQETVDDILDKLGGLVCDSEVIGSYFTVRNTEA
jgi:hypothetical protein